MKLKYRLRRFFKPRKHDRLVLDIRYCQALLKRINTSIGYYENLQSNGAILGDSLMETVFGLYRLRKNYEDKISSKKEEYKNKIK